jgi:branched-chain amino acid transport system substrate-binding protein
MFRWRYGAAMDGNSARTFTAAMTLFEAINRAGSSDPTAIRDALAATDVPAAETIMPWRGIRFDASGQNVLARGVIVQRIDGAYRTVWPFGVAAAKLVWPIPGYSMR